jgi:hypothetical protein
MVFRPAGGWLIAGMVCVILGGGMARGETTEEFMKRHPKWVRVTGISAEVTPVVPLDEGMEVALMPHGDEAVSQVPPIYKHAVVWNSDFSIKGDLRYVRKAENFDLYETFLAADREESGTKKINLIRTAEDSRRKIYALMYQNRAGLLIYENIYVFEKIAISYRLGAQGNTTQSMAAARLVGDFVVAEDNK